MQSGEFIDNRDSVTRECKYAYNIYIYLTIVINDNPINKIVLVT